MSPKIEHADPSNRHLFRARFVGHLLSSCPISCIAFGGSIFRHYSNPSLRVLIHTEKVNIVRLASRYGLGVSEAVLCVEKRLVSKVRTKRGKPLSGVYVNDLDRDEGEKRVREAYGATYARLVELKRRWDPDNVFCTNHNIAPAS